MVIKRTHGFIVNGERVSIRTTFDTKAIIPEYVLLQACESRIKEACHERWGLGVLKHIGWRNFMRQYVYERDGDGMEW